MAHALLDATTTTRLQATALTYAEVGATAGPLPPGYAHLRRTAVIGSGDAAFDRAGAAVLDWAVQRRAGIRVTSSTPGAQLDTVGVLRIGWGPVAVRAPFRVVRVIDEADRRGFAYGTLPGHPERGEEAFVVERVGDTVSIVITAFSRPATVLARLGGPVTSKIQGLMTQRYLRVLGE